MARKQISLLLLVGALLPMAAHAQTAGTGRILGRVVSSQSGELLTGAMVAVDGTDTGAISDVNGRYVLQRLAPGTYTLTAQTLGYGTKQITGVVVTTGETTAVDITLAPEAVALEALSVTATAERGSAVSVLSERQRSASVVDAIGAEQIANSPDGDAAAALKRVPGISVVDGKYVYVRGLGERYGNTTLNGAPLASPEPDRKVVPLDLVPADLLESVVTAKTYMPDQPGDYAGGLVQISTRSFPAFRLLKVGASAGYTSNGTFGNALLSPGSGSLDFFGFDDGSRNLPGLLPEDARVDRSNFTPEQLQVMGQPFADGVWGPVAQNVPLNSSFNVSFGDEFRIGDDPLGFLAAATLSNSYDVTDNLIERVFSSAGAADPEVDYAGQVGTRSVSFGGLATLSYQPAPEHQLTAEVVYNRLTSEEARRLEGYNLDSSTNQLNTRLRYLEQAVTTAQLRGKHALGGTGGTQVKWRGAYSRADRFEPQTREVLYREFDDVYYWDSFVQSGSTFHQQMDENGLSGGIDVDVPLEIRGLPAKLTIGGALDLRARDTYTRRFRFLPANGSNVSDDVKRRSPNELFTPETIGPGGFELREATFRTDNYDAEQEIFAGYAMLDAQVLPRLRLAGGVRYETTAQTVTPNDLFAMPGVEPLAAASLDAGDVLPALNLTYALQPAMNLRLGVSRTLARPQFRELAPFSFADYAGGYLTVGNPRLDRTRISNFDARWEWFFEPGALLAVSSFYKQFSNPIETLVFPSSELIKSWVNVDEAVNYGLELEARAPLGVLTSALEAFAVNANLTLVQSEVTTGGRAAIFLPGTGATDIEMADKTRALQGQSPYVANFGVTYAGLDRGLTASVLFNRFGRRIDSVGSQTLDEVYEEARSQLDVTVEKSFPAGLALKLTAGRLLGNEVRFTQGGDLLRGYDAGRTLSLSVSWEAAR